jgi:AraC family transcriptional regulator, regulatory protein of adaptative response / methylated-DNA-[protein]-cysteine methyltransferase
MPVMTMASRRGKTPPREAGRPAEEIRFAVGQSSLGSILVGFSEKGVVSILIREDPDHVVEDLQDRFPKALLVRGSRDDERVLRRVIDFVEEPTHDLDLPLDVRGTAFQQRVWQAVREIPAGRTTTYTDVAGRIGAPNAVRAVGNACSANNLAVAVPCHRVLHKDGSPTGGNHWSNGRQRAMLEREAEAVSRKRPTSAPRDE